MHHRLIVLAGACALAAFAGPASAAISCAQLPQAESFIGTLQPGPNTSAAQAHLDAAKAASGNEAQCSAELREVDKYARRSAAADKRMASRHSTRRVVQCADFLHQDRPGGTDYHGPYVPGCSKS